MNRIFVSIACLADSDIINTVEDCLAKAKDPDRIIFGICLQDDLKTIDISSLKDNKKYKVKRIHWSEAKGPTYARYLITKLVSDEEYFLQIDCHTRFFQNWDELIINELHKCEKLHPKSVISHYPLNIKTMHDPKFNTKIGHITTFREVSAKDIKSHGSLITLPSEPKQSWGMMAAMFFARSSTLKQVPYDEKTYHGYHSVEQFYYAVRLYTSGYNSYTPSVHVLAMEYETNRERVSAEIRSHCAKGASEWFTPTWQKTKYYLGLDSLTNVTSQVYVDDILQNQHIYGLGTVRSVLDYYQMTKLHDKLLNLYPYYQQYYKLMSELKDSVNLPVEIFNGNKNIAVVTQNTPNLIPSYYKNTRENHIAYCKRNDYTYYSFYSNLADETVNGQSPKICWSKAKAVINTIPHHEMVLWVDADTIFCKFNTRIEDLIQDHAEYDFYLTKDPKTHPINSGVMLWKNNEASRKVLDDWWNSEHIPYGAGGDQKGLYNVISKDPTLNWYKFTDTELNCYPSKYDGHGFIIHYMGVKSKINVNNRIVQWNKLLKVEDEEPEVYLSIATIPLRLDGLRLLVETAFAAKVKPTRVIFHVPRRFLRFPEHDKYYEELTSNLQDMIDNKRVCVNVLEQDYGSSNKLAGMEQYAAKYLSDTNFVAITADDDLMYHDYVVEELLNEYRKDRRAVISGYSNHSTYASKIGLTADKKHRVLISKTGNALLFPKYFFNVNCNPSFTEVCETIMKSPYPDAVFQDDHLVSAFMFYKKLHIISINGLIRDKYKDRTVYRHNPIIQKKRKEKNNDKGISHGGYNINLNHISHVVTEFSKYFLWHKYSNVDFI